MSDVEAGGKKKRKLSFWLKLLAGCVFLPPALLAGLYFLSITVLAGVPHSFPDAGFQAVTRRNLIFVTGFYEGDTTFTRVHSTLSPRKAISAIIKLQVDEDGLNHVSGPHFSPSGSRKYLEDTVASLNWPRVSPPPKELGWEFSYGDVHYWSVYVWDDHNGGSWIDVIEGASL